MKLTSRNSHELKNASTIHVLPSELLTHIFILGMEEHRHLRNPFSDDTGFQDIAIVSLLF